MTESLRVKVEVGNPFGQGWKVVVVGYEASAVGCCWAEV